MQLSFASNPSGADVSNREPLTPAFQKPKLTKVSFRPPTLTDMQFVNDPFVRTTPRLRSFGFPLIRSYQS